MRERQRILDLWHEMRGRNTSGVLVTVVKTRGSSYRRPGARLLVTTSGKRAGSISGGCLEDDVIKKAWWLTEKGPLVRRYDTTPDGGIGAEESPTLGFGTGCNGIVYLLMERLHGRDGERSPLAILDWVQATRKAAVLARVIAPAERAGETCIFEDGAWWPSEAESPLVSRIKEAANGFSGSGLMRLAHEEVFVETVAPSLRLLIFGAGDDAAPLTELGRQQGWTVSVYDGRAHYARPERFPQAHEVAVRNSQAGLADLKIDSRTAAVVMTHSYAQDMNFVSSLAKEPLAYLGVLGPRNRSIQLLTDAGLRPADLSRLYAPVGLDIGADGPDQVALAVVAEIQAAVNGRHGGSLRLQTGPIHSDDSNETDVDRRFTPSIVCV